MKAAITAGRSIVVKLIIINEGFADNPHLSSEAVGIRWEQAEHPDESDLERSDDRSVVRIFKKWCDGLGSSG
jgi:hypothetical protein